MADQSEKSKTQEVSSESRVEQGASRAGSEQAQADMPEHLQQTQKKKSAFDRAGLISTARSHVSETFGRPEISEENDGERILHVAEVSDKKAAKASDPHPSYIRGLEAARQNAATPDEAAKMEVKFTEQYIEKKLQEAATTSGKDPAELLNQHEYDPEDPNHGGTLKIPQNVAEKHSDGSVLLKINVSENVEATEEAQLKNTPDGWLEAGRRIAELPIDKQFEIIGSGLAAGINQYQHDENQRAWGRLIGTVQGIGEVSVNLAKIADFSAALILNDEERAGKMGAEFGQALGETIVGGVKLFNAAHQYLFNIGFTGDYSKPFRDVAMVGDALNQKWSELPPREQERIVSQLTTQLLAEGAITAGGASIISKAPKFTKILDTVAKETRELSVLAGGKAHKAADAVEEVIQDTVQQVLDGDINLGRTAAQLDELSAGKVPKRRHLLAEEGDKDELIPVPEDFGERMLHYNASAIEIRDAVKQLPEEIRQAVIKGYLDGRVRIVESMTDVADILKRAKLDVTDEYIEQLGGVFVTISDDAGEPIGDGIFVALTTTDRYTGERSLVKNTAGIFRHELSHAIDKLVGTNDKFFSDSDLFKQLNDLDHGELLGKLTVEELGKLQDIYLLDSSDVRQELFAQVLACKLGGCTFPEEQSLIQKAFPRIWDLVFGGEN
ncbi:MAG: hypothetical protein IPM23_18340 [Candidatus Melainabacteria bacterium]|nr:hypothetical protein [Candidatus Melainabacteria bacterium]